MPSLSFSSVSRLIKIVIPLIFISWMLFYFGLSKSRYDQVMRQLRSEKTVFINDFLQNEIDGDFDGSGIDRLCESKQWIPGLIMSCDAAPGGVGEVRNAQLHCIRIAMEVGAELILPEIVRRSETDITKTVPNSKGPIRGVPLSYLFDIDNLKNILSAHCPQMKVYDSLNDLYDVPSVLEPKKFKIKDLTTHFHNGTVLMRPHDLAPQFHHWLDTESPPAKRKYPIRVHMESTIYTFPVAADDTDVSRNFGRMLHVRRDARRLAAATLYTLSGRYRLSIDPRQSHRASAANESFAGIHLRTERDVDGKDHFPDYATQASAYFSHLVESQAHVSYLASGADDANAGGGGGGPGAHEDILAFQRRAADFGVTVVTKRDLLEGEELDALRRLSWDQRALVDYEVLLRAGEVLGTGASSFAWSLALRRAQAFGKGTEGSEDVDSGVLWRDEFSTLYGNKYPDFTGAMKQTIWA